MPQRPELGGDGTGGASSGSGHGAPPPWPAPRRLGVGAGGDERPVVGGQVRSSSSGRARLRLVIQGRPWRACAPRPGRRAGSAAGLQALPRGPPPPRRARSRTSSRTWTASSSRRSRFFRPQGGGLMSGERECTPLKMMSPRKATGEPRPPPSSCPSGTRPHPPAHGEVARQLAVSVSPSLTMRLGKRRLRANRRTRLPPLLLASSMRWMTWSTPRVATMGIMSRPAASRTRRCSGPGVRG